MPTETATTISEADFSVSNYRVEDTEHLLADRIAEACRATEHLFVEDAALDPAQEHDVRDSRDVDAGR